MPVVHPADIWQETGRWYEVGAEMARFKDRAQRDMVLGMTHEEVIADLIRARHGRDSVLIPNGVEPAQLNPATDELERFRRAVLFNQPFEGRCWRL